MITYLFLIFLTLVAICSLLQTLEEGGPPLRRKPHPGQEVGDDPQGHYQLQQGRNLLLLPDTEQPVPLVKARVGKCRTQGFQRLQRPEHEPPA